MSFWAWFLEPQKNSSPPPQAALCFVIYLILLSLRKPRRGAFHLLFIFKSLINQLICQGVYNSCLWVEVRRHISRGSILSYHVGPRDQTWVPRLGDKYPDQLSHLTSSQLLASYSSHYTHENTKAHKLSGGHELPHKHGSVCLMGENQRNIWTRLTSCPSNCVRPFSVHFLSRSHHSQGGFAREGWELSFWISLLLFCRCEMWVLNFQEGKE